MALLFIFLAVLLAVALRTAMAAAGVWMVCSGLNSAGITHIDPSLSSLVLIGLGISILVGINDIKADAR